ncbi:hypothetical protein ACP70R_038555 [Stipagrostis hirtigluma subsp. patula]
MAASYRPCSWLLMLRVAVLLLRQAAASPADFPLGGQATVQLPPAPYRPGFAARAVVLGAERKRQHPGFVAAVSAEAGAGGYACSLVVLLGDVKIWASDHLDKFVAVAMCRLELTGDGQLRLTDGAGTVGWASGTAGQGVKVLHLNGETGNLVLLDAQNHTRWQSFDGPTNIFLSGQQLTLPWYFIASTAKVNSTAAFYTFELDGGKIASYANLGETRYSYWELTPSANRTMASACLDGSGLRMLDTHGATVAQIAPPVKKPPVSFLALGDDGNLGMYFYDAHHQEFRASYMALGFCELPLSCGVGEVCSTGGKCNGFAAYADKPADARNASGGAGDLCHGAGGNACMVHLRGVSTALRTASPLANVTLRRCVELCAINHSCNAALYALMEDNASVATADNGGVCSHYTVAAGASEMTGGSRRYSYWVKIRARGGGRGEEDEEDDGASFHGMITKILMVCGAIDVVCAVVFAVLIALYFRRLRNLAVAVDEPQVGEIEVVEQNSTGNNDTAGQN